MCTTVLGSYQGNANETWMRTYSHSLETHTLSHTHTNIHSTTPIHAHTHTPYTLTAHTPLNSHKHTPIPNTHTHTYIYPSPTHTHIPIPNTHTHIPIPNTHTHTPFAANVMTETHSCATNLKRVSARKSCQSNANHWPRSHPPNQTAPACE